MGKEEKKPINLINNIDAPNAINEISSITSKPNDIRETFSAIKNKPKSTKTAGEPLNQNWKRFLIPSKDGESILGLSRKAKNVCLYIDVRKGNIIIGAI